MKQMPALAAAHPTEALESMIDEESSREHPQFTKSPCTLQTTLAVIDERGQAYI